MRIQAGVFTVICIILGCVVSCGKDEDSISSLDGYYHSGKVWPKKTLRVCWEDLDDSQAADRNYVQQRITDTWEKHSGLTFIGWDECEYFRDEDINIEVADIAPHSDGLGDDISL
ncbi:MAG: hypothetical protein HRU19_13785 [Pseudobacteriovorax sp.]|nr:hypothetical protein [Pseudobacteriovorax sp.]